jgi:hypothetical protein
MKLLMFLIATATALSLSFGLAPAHAGDSFVSIEQYGAANEFGSSQYGRRNRLTIYQNGRGNSSINSQEGEYNRGVIGQDGFGHFTDTYQGSPQHCRHCSIRRWTYRDHHSGRPRQCDRRDPGRPRQRR